jgi:hypothetical protein
MMKLITNKTSIKRSRIKIRNQKSKDEVEILTTKRIKK